MVFLYGASFEGLREGGPGCKARFCSIFRAGGYSGQLAKLGPELGHGANLVVCMMVGLQGTQIWADDYYLSTTIEAGYVTGIASLTHSPETSGASKTPSHAYTLLVLGVFIRLA